jgi:hypothetical protein
MGRVSTQPARARLAGGHQPSLNLLNTRLVRHAGMLWLDNALSEGRNLPSVGRESGSRPQERGKIWDEHVCFLRL